MNLYQDFLLNKGNTIHKWLHYFPAYERHLVQFRNRPLLFIEIGVSRGGSLEMWQRFFGPLATIVGVDINPQCARYESDGIFVRIGDQKDSSFLSEVVAEFGTPDVILDDGSHVMGDILSTFKFFYPRLSKGGVYIVEDLHTAYWDEYGGGLERPESFVNISKGLIDRLNADHSRGGVSPDFVTKNTFSITFYDSLVVFERGMIPVKKDRYSGLPV